MIHYRSTAIQAPRWWPHLLLGLVQILVWGGSFFLMAVLINPVVQDTRWPRHWVYGSLSISLFIAGLLAPRVGRLMAGSQGHRLLLASGLVIGAGLLLMARAPSLWVFVGGWCIIGVGMAMGLFEALFALLGRRYGGGASRAITHVTLISGLCTTITWPLLAWLIEGWGWRTACQLYAGGLVLTVWPLYRLALPRPATTPVRTETSFRSDSPAIAPDGPLIRLTALNFTLAAIIMTAITVQLITLLQAKGMPPGLAIGVGALIGPCQVGVRLLDLAVKSRHPIQNAVVSTGLTALGMLCLLGPSTVAIAGVVLYSLGNGLRSILRGTLPLALFGAAAYPIVLGRVARPALIAQALTPLLGGLLTQQFGPVSLVGVLGVLALLNVVSTALLHQRMRQLRLVEGPLVAAG